jgi:hypothetical protein
MLAALSSKVELLAKQQAEALVETQRALRQLQLQHEAEMRRETPPPAAKPKQQVRF